MTRFYLPALLLAFSSFSALAADNQLSAEEQRNGWQLLFDGKDMSKWRNFKQQGLSEQWVIEDGTIKGPLGMTLRPEQVK